MAGGSLKKPLEAAIRAWSDSQFRRQFTRDFYRQRREYRIAEDDALDFGLAIWPRDRNRVDDPLSAAAVLNPIAIDPLHSFRANALCGQGEYLVAAASDAYAEGWPQRQVESLWDQATAKFQASYQVAKNKTQFMKSKRLEAFDWDNPSSPAYSPAVASSAAAGLAVCRLRRGELEGARQLYQDVFSEDMWSLKDLLKGAAMYGPGLPQEIQVSSQQGPLWKPEGLREVVSPDLVYATVADGDPAVVRLTIWRWPVVDKENRLQWRAQERDEHSLDIVPASFWVAMGQLRKRPTGNAILALRLQGDYPVLQNGDSNHEFGNIFSAVVADITRDVHAKSLETVLSVDGRDQLSA